jgi:4-hydroxybenzoate polyprenyltransferase
MTEHTEPATPVHEPMTTLLAAPAGALRAFSNRTRILLEMIKFEHTIFSTPFALAAAVVAANGMPHWRALVWIVVALVGARSAAMAFNRIVDSKLDALNPRTKMRAIPTGQVSIGQAIVFAIVASALLVLAAWQLNPLALELSPLALLIVFGYSFTKRFTIWSHLFLGFALGIAPMGAWVAVRGMLEPAPFLLGAAVVFWLFGFDILYALQDAEFDRTVGLFSIPARLGNARALVFSRVGHAIMLCLMIAFGFAAQLHWIYALGVAMVAALIVYEQSLVKPTDLSRLDFAFFNLNGYVGIGYFLFTLADVLVFRRAWN